MSDNTPDQGGGGGRWGLLVVLLIVLGLPAYGIFTWFFCRLEVPPGHLAVKIAKTGEDLLGGEILATQEGQKGIQLETLKPGRHFLNPLFWDTEVLPIVDVPPGKVGVLTRLYGKNPDLGKGEALLVPLNSDLKGIVAEVLPTGLHEKINPWAYQVELVDAVSIEAGFVGVVCNMVGPEPKRNNSYLVEPGERGVQREVLKPGTYYLNPYAVQVYTVDVRSQRLELSSEPGGKQEDTHVADDTSRTALVFPSSDGFEIEVKLTVEWSIDEARAAEVLVRIGVVQDENPMAEILHKVLIPALRGNARIEGSKYPAANYIAGESRTIFQTSIFDSLKDACADQGILVRSVLVNDIVPPQDIARPIREREVAKEELTRNSTQLQQARAEQSLARETELVQQEQVRVESETEKEKRRIASEGAQRVALIEQEQLLVVAGADLGAAELQAKSIVARGQAEADVVVAQNQAEAQALRASVDAFSTPGGFAAFWFAQRIGPRVRTVFADPGGPFGSIFQELLQPSSTNGRRGQQGEGR
jgi:regulator of protease activity HflC (stomatin/prohibitin superfamily)